MIWSLVVDDRLREYVRYTRSEMRLPIVRRAAGSSRDEFVFGVTNDGVSWKVSTPNVCSATRPISVVSAPVNARAARSRSNCYCGVTALYWLNSTSCPGATSLNSRLSTCTSVSGGSEVKVGVKRAIVPVTRTMMR